MAQSQQRRFEERQKQIELARQRGENHIAADQTKQKLRKRQEREEQARRSNKEAF